MAEPGSRMGMNGSATGGKDVVCAQLNIHPNDIHTVPLLLPHQIRVWGPQVDRIHVTLDTHGVMAGHYKAVGLPEKLTSMRAALEEIGRDEPKLVVDEVDYSQDTKRAIARKWFDRESVPIKAWTGSPFYAYLYGMEVVDADFIVHFDGDMLFGGGSTTWVSEAIATMRNDPSVAFVGPHPGPPRRDGRILDQGKDWRGKASYEPAGEGAFSFDTVSTRIFMTSPALLRERMNGRLPWLPTKQRERLFASLLEIENEAGEFEQLLSEAMQSHGLRRIDMLGSAPGLWSLHPPFRNDEFVSRLPEFIERAEEGDMPDDQRGRYDLGPPLIDWSQTRREKGRAARWRAHVKHVVKRFFRRTSVPNSGVESPSLSVRSLDAR